MKPDYQVGIVGAGFAGIIAALRLLQSGRDSFVIFERATDVGGTWRDNIYPGCACDVPSNLYSISFEPNPNWKRAYSPQAEILEYLRDVVRKYDLEKHIRYNAEICHSQFVEADGCWQVTDRSGRTTTVRMLISATGPFSRPKLPAIAGIERFRGKTLHTARWDASYDFTEKRVAVIGTGASSIQIVPELAAKVAHMTIFQRTPAWVTARLDHAVPAETQERYRRFPLFQQYRRTLLYWVLEFRGRMFMGDQRIQRMAAKLSLDQLAAQVNDPEIRKKLTPNYTIGCKRILVSDDYLPCFNRPNVTLETAGIAEISEDGLVTLDGRIHRVDAIVFATGFEVADINTEAKLLGLDGRDLFSEWRATGMAAYRGTTIAGYPNLAYLLGPNTGLGHSSMIHVMESQMNYIMQYIQWLEASGDRTSLDLKPAVQQVHNQELQKRFAKTVWASGCKSWYLNRQGINTTLYPRLTAAFRQEMRRVNRGDYEVIQARGA